MANRTRKKKGLQPAPPEEPPKDRLAKWRRFTHRGTAIEYVPSGIVVDATTPAELVSETDAEILRRTKNDPEN
jgi:hypothetical protein